MSGTDQRKRVVVTVLVVAIAAVLFAKGAVRAGSSEPPASTPSSIPTSVEAAVKRARLLELGSETCVPCRAMQPVLDELRRVHGKHLQVDFIDVRRDEVSRERYKVEAIPTQVFFDAEGRELFRHVGYFSSKDIVATFRRFGITLGE